MTFREAREHILYAFSENFLNDEDFVFFICYDLNTSKSLDFHYQEYGSFDLDAIFKDDAYTEFRFFENDISRLAFPLALRLSNVIVCSFHSDVRIDSVKSLCILIKQLAYPNRYSDMISWFGGTVPQLSMVVKQMMDKIDSEFGHLLGDLNQCFLM